MKKFYSFMEEKLVPFTNRVASIPFLVVMRNAMMSLVALLVVGSIAAMIAKLPIDAFQTVMAPVIPLFTAINQATTRHDGTDGGHSRRLLRSYPV